MVNGAGFILIGEHRFALLVENRHSARFHAPIVLFVLGGDCHICTVCGDRHAAKESAEYCEYELRGIATFPETLEHLSMAIGPGVSAVEKVIQEYRQADKLYRYRLVVESYKEGIIDEKKFIEEMIKTLDIDT